jgi:hypothetical protein
VGKRRSDCSMGVDGVGTSRDGWMIDKSANGEGDGHEGLGFGWCYDGLAASVGIC